MQTFPKPAKGTAVLEREARKAQQRTKEREAKQEAKRRAGYRCLWPEPHKCRGPLEGAHIVDKSLGGENVPENIFPCCRWVHRAGPDSIHGKQLKVEREPDGSVTCWRRFEETRNVLGEPDYYLVRRIFPDGRVERD